MSQDYPASANPRGRGQRVAQKIRGDSDRRVGYRPGPMSERFRSAGGALVGRKSPRSRSLGLLCAILLGIGGPACDAPRSASEAPVDRPSEPVGPAVSSERGESAVYVPAYAYAPSGDGRRVDLTATLTIHNVSMSDPLVLRSVEYHDSPGERVESYLSSPQTLQPLETVEFLVNRPEGQSGVGANFIVSFDAQSGANFPFVEALLVGNAGNGWLSFTSRGVPVSRGR